MNKPAEHLAHKGDSWNESALAPDSITGRPVRRLTAAGFNEKPTYHTNTAFTADGEFLVFVPADMLMWLHWDAEAPRLEPICRHATEWDTLSDQLHDPHPAADPTGRCIAFNAAHGGRSDVYTVEVEP